jgi:hypothetical protein
MQATITRPHQGSVSSEGSAVRVVAGLVVSALAVAAFMVTREGSSAEPAPAWDEVSVVHDPAGAGGARSSAATSGLILGDHLYVDLEGS